MTFCGLWPSLFVAITAMALIVYPVVFTVTVCGHHFLWPSLYRLGGGVSTHLGFLSTFLVRKNHTVDSGGNARLVAALQSGRKPPSCVGLTAKFVDLSSCNCRDVAL